MRRTRWLALAVGALAGVLAVSTGWAVLVTGAGTLLAVAFVAVLLGRQVRELRVLGRRPSTVRLALRALATARPGPRTP
ncbi:MAG: hypothetical protein QOI35_716 [Cryptosporangiaceae bacterium]|jgi:hypothetical protein|nr:hypothetical protein [Cryptosporangiaceae bacterium]